jgi:hypothetical protein
MTLDVVCYSEWTARQAAWDEHPSGRGDPPEAAFRWHPRW